MFDKDLLMNNNSLEDKNDIIKQLMDENQMLRKMLDQSSDGIFIVDGREDTYGNSIYCNPVLYNLLGVQSDEIIGRNIEEYKGQFVSKMATLDSMENDNKPMTVMQTMVRTHRKALVTSTPIYDENDKLVCFFVQAKDIVKYEQVLNDLNQGDRGTRQRMSMSSGTGFFEENTPVIAEDPRMVQVLQLAQRLSSVDSGILLTGETGVGKEVLAKFIHSNSPRKKGPFVTANCATFQKELIESELFGYESGSFTGAKKGGKLGMFEAAKGGTLFLDEINSLPLDMQGKLLRAIETKKIRAVGGNHEYDVDFRLIVATNERLEKLLENKTFREDLYYRINVFSIDIPPLRERRGDIAALLEYFTRKYALKYNIDFQLTEREIKIAEQLPWRGNVRELRNYAERMVVIGDTDSAPLLQGNLLKATEKETCDLQKKEISPEMNVSHTNHMDEKVGNSCEDIDWSEVRNGTLREQLSDCEKQILKNALNRYSLKREVAQALGIDPAVLSRKLSKHGL